MADDKNKDFEFNDNMVRDENKDILMDDTSETDNLLEEEKKVVKNAGFKDIEEFIEEQEKEIQEKKTKSKKSSKKDGSDDGGDNEDDKFITTKSVETVLHESMLPYSEFVIMDRALPRVEDGLKPVQRRVLYSMLEVGVLPDRPYRKSARIVGDCMGKYHPHGDSSIYGTMVRMAQDFNMEEVLVDGHGNYGSVDGDGAAAMRYTEAKLSPIALELLRDLEKDTVTWSFNFDDSCKEPDMLPGRFPNLLVNGSYGIAVGLATNIPTHNLRETCKAVCAYIDNKDIKLRQLMEILPGPDFPTGAYILNNSELKQIYHTGKGKIYIRSKIYVENVEGGKKNIVITEIPFQVNKAQLLQKIAALKETDESGVLSYISEIVDESDRSGTRAVIKLKKDARVGSILALLLKSTDLQTTFNANIVAIADGKPKQMGLIEIIDYYVNYQQKIIYNRTRFDLEACLKKEHILEGLLIAINNIDEVVKIIKQSKSVTDAKIQLIQKFMLSEAQAQAILDMRLARLTNLEVNKLIAELNRLKDLIKRYTAILKSPTLQMKVVKQELTEIAKNYGRDRRTQFLDPNDDLPEEESEVKEEEVSDIHIIFSPQRTIKAVTPKNYNLSIKELGLNANLFEIPNISIKTQTNKDLYVFTNLGNCVKINAGKVALCKFKDRGANLSAHYKNIEDNERVIACLEFNETNADEELIFFTKNGFIKITKIGEYFAAKQVISAIKLKDDKDELIGVEFNRNGKQVGIFTKNGIGMIVPKDDINPIGRVSAGVKGLNLADNDEVVSAMLVGKKDTFTFFANNGATKALVYDIIPKNLRNKKGTKILGKKLDSTQIVKVGIYNKSIDYVLESATGELQLLKSENMPLESIDAIGKYMKNIRGDKMLKAVYEYVIN